MAIVDRVRELVSPLVEAESVTLYDIEHNGGVVRVLVDGPDGVDIAAVARISRAVSRMLDEHDPIPGRYTLEVSSPGLERPLRTAEHFRLAIGNDIKVKTVPEFDGARRITGVLTDADDTIIELRDADDIVHRVEQTQISSARTVFDWGPTPKPGGGSTRTKKSQKEATP